MIPLTVTFRDGSTVTIAPENLPVLEAAIRAWKRTDSPTRNLRGEIAVYLADHPNSPTEQVARGIRARDEDVRAVLNRELHFVRARGDSAGVGRARRWMLAPSGAEPVPSAGTDASSDVGGTA